jgi:hypothetical protein
MSREQSEVEAPAPNHPDDSVKHREALVGAPVMIEDEP